MGWGKWFSDVFGGGEVREKRDGGSTHYLRTSDNAKTGSRNDHSHVVVTSKPSGHTSAHARGIRGGERK